MLQVALAETSLSSYPPPPPSSDPCVRKTALKMGACQRQRLLAATTYYDTRHTRFT